MEKSKTGIMAVRIAHDLRRKIEKLAQADKRTLSNMAVILLERAVNEENSKQASAS